MLSTLLNKRAVKVVKDGSLVRQSSVKISLFISCIRFQYGLAKINNSKTSKYYAKVSGLWLPDHPQHKMKTPRRSCVMLFEKLKDIGLGQNAIEVRKHYSF